MGSSAKGAEPGLLRVRTVCGEPYEVAGRKLVPVARVVSFGKGRGTLGSARASGWGAGFVRITPLAFLEETADGQRCIAITDATGAALRGLWAVAVALTVLSMGVVLLGCRRRSKACM